MDYWSYCGVHAYLRYDYMDHYSLPCLLSWSTRHVYVNVYIDYYLDVPVDLFKVTSLIIDYNRDVPFDMSKAASLIFTVSSYYSIVYFLVNILRISLPWCACWYLYLYLCMLISLCPFWSICDTSVNQLIHLWYLCEPVHRFLFFIFSFSQFLTWNNQFEVTSRICPY